jgi:cell division transport system permease protein
MLALTLMGVALLFLLNANNLAQNLESQVEIVAFVDSTVDDEGLNTMMAKLNQMPGVAAVRLTTKEEALVEFMPDETQRQQYMEDVAGINPMPNSFTITAIDVDSVTAMAEETMKMAGIENVQYGADFLDQMLQLTKWLRWAGIIIVAVFTLTTMMLISLNIKTNVQMREQEVQIMRLVGAENFLIRGPFFLEGLLIGLIGAIISALVVGSSYSWLIVYIADNMVFLPVVADSNSLYSVLEIMLLAGALIGALASAFSVRRFLRI